MIEAIIENYLNDEDILEVHEIIEREGSWKYTGHSDDKNPHGTKFWYMDLLDTFPEFVDKHLRRIENIFKKKFKVNNAYINGHTYNQDGSFHQDDNAPGTYTFLIYSTPMVNETNTLQVGGLTEFWTEAGLMKVEPIFGRAIMFDSRISHRGTAPYHKNILRTTIAFKLKLV